MFQVSTPSSQDALKRRGWDSKVSELFCDILIDCCTIYFRPRRCACFDDVQDFDSRWDQAMKTASATAMVLQGFCESKLFESFQLQIVLTLEQLETKNSSAGEEWVESNWTNVRKETHAVSVRIPHLETDARRDKKDNRLLLHWKRRHILTERCSPKVQTAEESAFRTRGRLPCRNFLRGKCSYPSCNFGHPPVSLRHKSVSGCTCGDECWFRSVETDGQSSRKSKKSCVKVSVALWKNSVQFGCVSQYSYRREAIQRKIGKLRSNGTVTFSKGTWHHIKFWERKGPSRAVIQQFEPHERSPCDLKCGERTKEILHQEKHARGVACDLAKSVLSNSKIWTKATFFSFAEGWSGGRPFHWQLLPLWRSWTFEGFLVRLSVNLVGLLCALMKEFSLFWLFRRGCQFYQWILRSGVERGHVPRFELQDRSRQVPCFCAGASFLLQSFLRFPNP